MKSYKYKIYTDKENYETNNKLEFIENFVVFTCENSGDIVRIPFTNIDVIREKSIDKSQ